MGNIVKSPFGSLGAISSSINFSSDHHHNQTKSTNQNKIRILEKLSGSLDAKPGLYSNYKPSLFSDITNLIEVNQPGSNKSRRPVQVKDAVYKRFFKDLTEAF